MRYDLIDIDFHHPSEETVKNKLSDMSIHLVHQSADGKLAIIAVRFKEDMGNPNAVSGHAVAPPAQKGRRKR